MIETTKLEEIIIKCRIIKQFQPLDNSILGYYYCDGNYYIILLNELLKENESLYRCVLAEEIGHYRTTIGDATPRKYMSYKNRLFVDKQEWLALKWATDFLIPTEMLLDALRAARSVTLYDLLDDFCVTQEFFMQKLEFMSKQNCIWDIDSKRSLFLYDFPGVYIYEKM